MVLGEKEWETRSRPNFRLVGKRIAVHSSKAFAGEDRRTATGGPYSSLFLGALGKHGMSLDTLPLGCVIGMVSVEDCLRVEAVRGMLPLRQHAFGDWSDGRWCFRLSNPVSLGVGIPAKGALCVWEWDAPEGFEETVSSLPPP